jgi:hypothetical protein
MKFGRSQLPNRPGNESSLSMPRLQGPDMILPRFLILKAEIYSFSEDLECPNQANQVQDKSSIFQLFISTE